MPLAVYTFLICLIALLMPFKLIWRGFKQPDYFKHWAERYGFYDTPAHHQALLWIHCVSVGESRAAHPLMLALLNHYPHHHLLITHGTPTGRDTSTQMFKNTTFAHRVTRVYLPIDLPFAVNRFFKHFQPVLGLLMETELWFNLIEIAHKRSIPIGLINARMSEKSAQGYRKLGHMVGKGLQKLHWVAAQSVADQQRFVSLGAPNTQVCGNIKFDVLAPTQSCQQGQTLRNQLGHERPVFLAASTRKGEEALVLDAIKDLPILTLLVPRHPQRFKEVENLLKQHGLTYMLRTNITKQISSNTQVVLGNTMGEMYTYYAACDVAFIGGSLLDFGGQNLIEAASMSKPLLFGPYMYNFNESAQLALNEGAAIQVADAQALKQQASILLTDRQRLEKMATAAYHFSQSYTGATEKILAKIKTILPQTL